MMSRTSQAVALEKVVALKARYHISNMREVRIFKILETIHFKNFGANCRNINLAAASVPGVSGRCTQRNSLHIFACSVLFEAEPAACGQQEEWFLASSLDRLT
jgi:hypothetical protein